ncbi:DNA mismatch repair protein MutS [bacterium]|nr:DNA mismatch repair protein MutS [candidate division CSSED10-310 bacterium]
MKKRQDTPLMKQYREVKARHPDAILFYRMGDFYEMFGEDAQVAAPVLDIVLTSRDRNAEEKIPMCGVPYHSAETYIAKLIENNFKVAICEQVEDPGKARGIVKREVIRVITPGTVLESNLLKSSDNNFIASVAILKDMGGLALLDLSTGEFLATEMSVTGGIDPLIDELRKWIPREIIHPQSRTDLKPDIPAYFNTNEDWVYSLDYAVDLIRSQFSVQGLEGFGLEGKQAAAVAAGAMLHYLQGTHVEKLGHLMRIRYFENSDYVYIDPSSRRNLELTRTLMGQTREGSLLDLVDCTVTHMGGRLLKTRLEQPLTDVQSIESRLEEVDAFYQNDTLRNDTQNTLKPIADLERLAGRIATGIAHARDLIALRTSIEEIPRIVSLLEQSGSPVLTGLTRNIDTLADIGALIQKSIRDSPPLSIREGNIIRTGYDEQLDEIRRAATEGRSWIAQLQTRERSRTRIPSLKISYNRVFGYYIEVTRTHLEKIPDNFIRKQTLVNAERFITPELKEMEEKILGAEEKMAGMEFDLFAVIRERIAAEVLRIQTTARVVARIDVASALAELAVKYRYRRPSVDAGDRIEIHSGRHPVVERIQAADGFVSNDVLLNGSTHRELIITGPNMAGKSTFIRQVALIVLLAQTGSFVPADDACIGVVDRIFTRVGASDNLAGGQSTFMVEMNEAANILNHATAKSLIILDEIGRGTSTFDGLSIAWAVAEHIHQIGARTLFATHYHELTELSERLTGVKNFNVEVREWNDRVIFLRKVVPGGVDRSYGIQVARLAGIPAPVLQRAREVLDALEMQERGRLPETPGIPRSRYRQLELFISEPPELLKELKTLDIDNLTPLEALRILNQWKKKFSG